MKFIRPPVKKKQENKKYLRNLPKTCLRLKKGEKVVSLFKTQIANWIHIFKATGLLYLEINQV